MLFFELFPAFMMLVAFGAGVWLLVLDRQASREAIDGESAGGEGGSDAG
jgi:hypothetical protein